MTRTSRRSPCNVCPEAHVPKPMSQTKPRSPLLPSSAPANWAKARVRRIFWAGARSARQTDGVTRALLGLQVGGSRWPDRTGGPACAGQMARAHARAGCSARQAPQPAVQVPVAARRSANCSRIAWSPSNAYPTTCRQMLRLKSMRANSGFWVAAPLVLSSQRAEASKYPAMLALNSGRSGRVARVTQACRSRHSSNCEVGHGQNTSKKMQNAQNATPLVQHTGSQFMRRNVPRQQAKLQK